MVNMRDNREIAYMFKWFSGFFAHALGYSGLWTKSKGGSVFALAFCAHNNIGTAGCRGVIRDTGLKFGRIGDMAI